MIKQNYHIINETKKATYKHLLIDNKLRVAITNSCNLSCFYCHNEGQELNCKPQFLSLEYIKNMVKYFEQNEIYVESVNLTGGEPLMHPHFMEIVKEMTKITDEIRINTNATLLTKELIDEMVRNGVYALKIGIDALYAKQSKPNIYHTQTNLEHVIEMIKYASEHMHIVLNTVVTKFNYKEIKQMVEFARKTNIPRIKIIRLHDVDSRDFNHKDVAEDYKTNQLEGMWYYYFFAKYVHSAVKIVNHPYKGRTDVFFKDGFEIRFCEDICNFGACGSMFTEIDSSGNLMICPKFHISTPIDFSLPYENVTKIIEYGKNKACNSERNYYEIREKNGGLSDEFFR